MALIQASIESGQSPSPLGDPFDWSVDEVIYFVCEPLSPVLRWGGGVALPDPQGFAKLLRDEQIDGEALLTTVTKEVLRNDLGVRPLGALTKIVNLIERMQHQSAKYQEKLQRQVARDRRFSNLAQMSWYNSPYFRSPQPPNETLSIDMSNDQRELGAVLNRITPLPNPSPSVADLQQTTNNSSEIYQTASRESNPSSTKLLNDEAQEISFVDEKGRKRRRLVLAPSNTANPTLHVGPSISAKCAREGHMQEPQTLGNSHSHQTDIQVINLLSHLSPVDEGSSANLLIGDQHINDKLRPQDVSVCPSGNGTSADLGKRKRVQPILIDEPENEGPDRSFIESVTSHEFRPATQSLESSHDSKGSTLDRIVRRANHHIYYGLWHFPVDDIFYPNVNLGQVIEDEEQSSATGQNELSFISNCQPSDAQRLYVNSRMKYFFRSTASNLLFKGAEEVGIIPYPDRLGKKNRPLSMTVFTRKIHGISKIRADRLQWTSTINSAAKSNIANGSSSFNALDPPMIFDDDNENWDALEKWKYIGNDEVLPVYGDSSSEGEYDLQTWKEMAGENGRTVRDLRPSNKSNLALEEVEAALDNATKEYCEEWHLKRRPRIEHRAWHYWQKARRDDTTDAQIRVLDERLAVLDDRMLRLRAQITNEVWAKVDEVTKQSKVMQPSIFEKEECQWKSSILRSKVAPQKTPKPVKNRHAMSSNTEPVQYSDEKADESSDETEETDDELDGFIVHDEFDDDTTKSDLRNEDRPLAENGDTTISNESINDSPEDVSEMEQDEKSLNAPKIEACSETASTKAVDFIDLTQASGSSQTTSPKVKSTRIVTPPIMDMIEDSKAWFKQNRGIEPEFKHPPDPDAISVIELDSDIDESTPLEASAELPPFKDVRAIKKLDPIKLVEKQDRKRLLVWLIAHTERKKRRWILKFVKGLTADDCLVLIKDGLKTMKAGKSCLSGKDQKFSDGVLQICAWYAQWTIPVKLDHKGVSISHIKKTLENNEGFESFYDFLLECLRYYKQSSSAMRFQSKRNKRDGTKDHSLSDDSTASDPRKFASESQETIQKRSAAILRMREDAQRAQQRAEREKRRKELMPRLAALSALQTEASEVILNPGKLDEQDSIYLNSDFGRGALLKPHQKEGLQFMWREITGDHKDLQGCLLAQTMGLGKTIQVIALLVAISDVANSPNENIRNQIPVELHTSQTLVLCPPGLIENWWDEFLMWPPLSNHLGELRKVSASLRPDARVREILAWRQEGGILLIGYHTFKDLILNKSRTPMSDKGALDDNQYSEVRFALLEKPNIVVADEAHEFKNQKSNISQAINQIQCKSRIALTGSPLSNNLGEYFATIDWISPGYLGPYSDFRDVYELPIQEGLYQDVSPARYRDSRKKLKALELELEPKIHRADLSALHGNLKGKSEFVIRVPLTTLQDRLYRDIISNVGGMQEEDGDQQKITMVWSYLAVLQLLCNHPVLFQIEHKAATMSNDENKVRQDQEHPQAIAQDPPSVSPSEDPMMDKPLTENILSRALQSAQMALNDLGGLSGAIDLSNKMQTLMRIIELSCNTGDKVLVFSHRHATLDYIGIQLKNENKRFSRIDGKTPPQKRQNITKSFNDGPVDVCLISTRAGGQGLNLFGANRVVILDSHFNPMWEQQAVGRAYRLGQRKHVFVYRLTAAGTFEEEMQNQALFKEQLATRVLEKRNPHRIGRSGARQYLFTPRAVEKSDISCFAGKDSLVLDHLLVDEKRTPIISITPSETFYVDDGQDLTAQERQEAQQMLQDEQLRRRNPLQYQSVIQRRIAQRRPLSFNVMSSSGHSDRQPQGEYVAAPRGPLPSVSTPSSSIAPLASNYEPYLPDASGRESTGAYCQTPWDAHGIPRFSGGPIVSASSHGTASQMDKAEGLLAHFLSVWASSNIDRSNRQRAPELLRIQAEMELVNLIAQKHSSASSPGVIGRDLTTLIDAHASNQSEFVYFRSYVNTLLEGEYVDPDGLLQMMLAKHGESRNQEERGPGLQRDTVTALEDSARPLPQDTGHLDICALQEKVLKDPAIEADHQRNKANKGDNDDGTEPSEPLVPTLEKSAALEIASAEPEQTQENKRSHEEDTAAAENARPTKKPKSDRNYGSIRVVPNSKACRQQ